MSISNCIYSCIASELTEGLEYNAKKEKTSYKKRKLWEAKKKIIEKCLKKPNACSSLRVSIATKQQDTYIQYESPNSNHLHNLYRCINTMVFK